MPISRRLPLLIMVFPFTLCFPVFADEHGSATPSPEAARLLSEVAQEYRNLPSYADEGELKIEYVAVPNKGQGKSTWVSAKAQLVFARPNLMALRVGSLRIYCDGKKMTVVIDSTHRYFVAPAPPQITLDTFREPRMKDLVFRDQYGLNLGHLLSLLLGETTKHHSATLAQVGWELKADRVVGDKPCKCIRMIEPEGNPLFSLLGDTPRLELLIDPVTKRLLSIEEVSEVPLFLFTALPMPIPPELDLPPGAEGPVADAIPAAMAMYPKTVRWTAGTITCEKPKASAFTFEAPRGYTRVDAFEELFTIDPQALAPVRS